MNTLLADPPAVASTEQPPATETPGAAPSGSAPEVSQPTPTASQPTCANCGAPMDAGQDWCLQCGAGAPGSLEAGGPSWRSAAMILTATAVLVLGAAAAAYAALNKESAPKARAAVVAVTPAPTAVTPTTPVTPTPTPTTPGAVTPTPTPTPKASETPPATNPLLSSGSSQPPKIPFTAPTPKSSPTTTTPTKTNESSGTTTPGSGTAGEPKVAAITLDPDAAATYNPYGYPESEFGDPSLAIDGDTSTAWTAQVNPAVAPKMAEGLVIDLKTARRISAVELITSTPGMSVQVYGANGSAPPTSITDPAWIQLSRYLVEKKHNDRIKLQSSTKAFRFITLWISKAPAGSAGTAQAPDHVAVNELELVPVK